MNGSITAQACAQVFNERRKFIILGLTGRTGSGCTTIANILGQSFDDFCPPLPHSPSNFSIDQNRKYHTCFNYLKANWHSFYHIKLSSLITSFILEKTIIEFLSFVKNKTENTNFIFSKEFSDTYKKLNLKRKKYKKRRKKVTVMLIMMRKFIIFIFQK